MGVLERRLRKKVFVGICSSSRWCHTCLSCFPMWFDNLEHRSYMLYIHMYYDIMYYVSCIITCSMILYILYIYILSIWFEIIKKCISVNGYGQWNIVKWMQYNLKKRNNLSKSVLTYKTCLYYAPTYHRLMNDL